MKGVKDVITRSVGKVFLAACHREIWFSEDCSELKRCVYDKQCDLIKKRKEIHSKVFLENIGPELSSDHRTTIWSRTKGKSPKSKPRNHNLVWTTGVSFTIWKYTFALKIERGKNKAPGQAKTLFANWFCNFKCGSVSTEWLIETHPLLHSCTLSESKNFLKRCSRQFFSGSAARL